MQTIGILGDGQLAQMLALASYQLGLSTLCFAITDRGPASRLSKIYLGDLNSQNDLDPVLDKFIEQVDVITLENENIDYSCLSYLNKSNKLRPRPDVIRITQDRLLEKQFLKNMHIPTAEFNPVNNIIDVQEALREHDNGIVKTRRFGYDGKGQVHIGSNNFSDELIELVTKQPAIFEKLVPFDYEVSLLIARNQQKQIMSFPLIKNQHQKGILIQSQFMDKNLDNSGQLFNLADEYGRMIVSELDYIGLMAIEFFVLDSQLLVNEIAPRVHNSGHLTIEGCQVSQFEQHLRAIMNLELIEPKIVNNVIMHNIIGQWPDNLTDYLHKYDYGKQPRLGRKLGHVIYNNDKS